MIILKTDEVDDQDVNDAESNEDADQKEEDSSIDTDQAQPAGGATRRFKSRNEKGAFKHRNGNKNLKRGIIK